MDTFAQYEKDMNENETIKLSVKEYAKICLNCSFSHCKLDRGHTCPTISKYRCNKTLDNFLKEV